MKREWASLLSSLDNKRTTIQRRHGKQRCFVRNMLRVSNKIQARVLFCQFRKHSRRIQQISCVYNTFYILFSCFWYTINIQAFCKKEIRKRYKQTSQFSSIAVLCLERYFTSKEIREIFSKRIIRLVI